MCYVLSAVLSIAIYYTPVLDDAGYIHTVVHTNSQLLEMTIDYYLYVCHGNKRSPDILMTVPSSYIISAHDIRHFSSSACYISPRMYVIDRVSLQIRYSACFRPLSSLLLLYRLYDGAAVSNMYNCVCVLPSACFKWSGNETTAGLRRGAR
jgi:hypothetical protein